MKPFLTRLRDFVIGPPRDPMHPDARHSVALVAFLAWVGIGADGVSSANYGPPELFVALGTHMPLALYLAAATALTVFVIAIAYNQVVELFPSGGGGYKVASKLIGPYAGLFSGSALLIDYVLTVAISIAAASDALFSLMPLHYQAIKLPVALAMVIALLLLNLRGVKESIKILMPLFMGFLVTHIIFIILGIALHARGLSNLIPNTIHETHSTVQELGWVGMLALLMRAFALGGGTYTGIEAVSNNVNMLKEPRVHTGKVTMMYMAVSLAFLAGGLIILYLLWEVVPQEGMTLNAVTFQNILAAVLSGQPDLARGILIITMFFAAALLFVAANAGYLAGPAVLANMARDHWMPHQFRQLSSRLVTHNGMILMAIAALLILLITQGRVDVLVVLYSINVFITFSLSLWGLTRYWVQCWHKGARRYVVGRLVLSVLAALLVTGILIITLFEKFAQGGWLTMLFTGSVVILCLFVRRHYFEVMKHLNAINQQIMLAADGIKSENPPVIDHAAPTAVFLVADNVGLGMHLVQSVFHLFPGRFKNFVFLRVGEVDTDSFEGDLQIAAMQRDVVGDLRIYVNHTERAGIAAESYYAYGPDKVHEVTKLAQLIHETYPDSIFFATKLIFEHENLFTRMLHNNTAYAVQRQLHLANISLMILPMKV